MIRPRKTQAGMTLIEVLVSVLIFSFGILGMVGLLARATKISVDADDRNRASLFANEVAAQMWAARSITLPEPVVAALKARLDEPGIGAGLTGGNFTVAPIAGSLNTKNQPNAATIRVTWRPVARAADQQQESVYETRVVIE